MNIVNIVKKNQMKLKKNLQDYLKNIYQGLKIMSQKK